MMYSKILNILKAEANVEGSCIVSRDGMLIYSDLADVHAEVFAAMMATLLSSAEVSTDEIKGGIPKTVTVKAKNKKIIIRGAGTYALLASVVTVNSKNVTQSMQRAVRSIEAIASDRK